MVISFNNTIKIIFRLFKKFKEYKIYILPIIFFEIVYLFKSRKFFDEISIDNFSKNFNNKNLEYIPTPYYILHLLNKNIGTIDQDFFKYNFIDFGSGKGRSCFYFKNKFIKCVGIDINNEYKKFYNFKNFDFIPIDCRKINDLKNKLDSYDKNVLYFFHPFEEELILEILNIFSNNKNILVIFYCCNPKIDINKYQLIYKKIFGLKNNNLLIYQKN